MLYENDFDIVLNQQDVFEKKYVLTFNGELPQINEVSELPKVKNIIDSGRNYYFSTDKSNEHILVLTIYLDQTFKLN